MEIVRYEAVDESVRNETDEDGGGDGQQAENDANGPLDAGLGVDGESGAADEDDKDLPPDDDELDADEEFVVEDAFEDVETVV